MIRWDNTHTGNQLSDVIIHKLQYPITASPYHLVKNPDMVIEWPLTEGLWEWSRRSTSAVTWAKWRPTPSKMLHARPLRSTLPLLVWMCMYVCMCSSTLYCWLCEMLACGSHLHSKNGISAAESGEGEHGYFTPTYLNGLLWVPMVGRFRCPHHHKPLKFKIIVSYAVVEVVVVVVVYLSLQKNMTKTMKLITKQTNKHQEWILICTQMFWATKNNWI